MLILERRCGDGQLRSAMDYLSKKEDEEEKEIESNLIDDVSLQVNELYTALYGIELDKEQG